MSKISSLLLLSCFTWSMLSCENTQKKTTKQTEGLVQENKKAQQREVDPALAQRIKSGQNVYTEDCAVCHQESGTGVPNMYPTLHQTDYILGDKTWLINLMLQGSSEQTVEIDGATFSGIMPAFSTTLDDTEIADVLTYVRNSFDNEASAVKTEEVQHIRESIE